MASTEVEVFKVVVLVVIVLKVEAVDAPKVVVSNVTEDVLSIFRAHDKFVVGNFPN